MHGSYSGLCWSLAYLGVFMVSLWTPHRWRGTDHPAARSATLIELVKILQDDTLLICGYGSMAIDGSAAVETLTASGCVSAPRPLQVAVFRPLCIHCVQFCFRTMCSPSGITSNGRQQFCNRTSSACPALCCHANMSLTANERSR